MNGMASLHAHPNADVEKGSSQTNALFFDALSNIPYITEGKSGQDLQDDGRMRAIEEYRKLRDDLLEEKYGATDDHRRAVVKPPTG